jgi:hypothetical protein
MAEGIHQSVIIGLNLFIIILTAFKKVFLTPYLKSVGTLFLEI